MNSNSSIITNISKLKDILEHYIWTPNTIIVQFSYLHSKAVILNDIGIKR